MLLKVTIGVSFSGSVCRTSALGSGRRNGNKTCRANGWRRGQDSRRGDPRGYMGKTLYGFGRIGRSGCYGPYYENRAGFFFFINYQYVRRIRIDKIYWYDRVVQSGVRGRVLFRATIRIGLLYLVATT